MLTRINFLLGVGMLTAIAFYLIGSYLVVLPLSSVAPGWVKPAAGIAILASLGLTVQILSTVVSDLAGVASYSGTGSPGAFAIASQSAILCGHLGLGYSAVGLFAGERPVTDLGLLVVAALYAAGIAIAVGEWRQRKANRT